MSTNVLLFSSLFLHVAGFYKMLNLVMSKYNILNLNAKIKS